MQHETRIKWSFIAGFIAFIVIAYLKITHSSGAEFFLGFGIVSTLIFIISAKYEVVTSKRIDHIEKTMWTLSLIFFSYMAGIVYFLMGRRRVV
jgi:hypothetical protein